MELKSLEAFVWIAKLGSFRLAAEKLEMTQPAVSQRILGLEAELGRRLVDRDRRPLSLTAAGRQALFYAERLLALQAELARALSDDNGVGGFIRLGVAETIAHTWLCDFMKQITDLYPNLIIEIEVSGSAALRTGLTTQSIELAFLVGGVTSPNIQSLPLCSYPVAFFASPSLGLGGKVLKRRDLAERPIITSARNTQTYDTLKGMFSHPIGPTARIHASASLAAAIRMAENGTGIAFIPHPIVIDQLERGVLEKLETDLILPSLSFFACWLQGHQAAAPETLAQLGRESAQIWDTKDQSD